MTRMNSLSFCVHASNRPSVTHVCCIFIIEQHHVYNVDVYLRHRYEDDELRCLMWWLFYKAGLRVEKRKFYKRVAVLATMYHVDPHFACVDTWNAIGRLLEARISPQITRNKSSIISLDDGRCNQKFSVKKDIISGCL